MRPRDRFYLAVMVFGALSPVAFAAPAASWGPAWRQMVPAGGPISLSRALLTIAPGGQTVVVDLPSALKQTRVSWPAGTRKAALQAAVLAADRGAAIALGERCAGELLTVYTRAPDLGQATAAGGVGAATGAAVSALPSLAQSAHAEAAVLPAAITAHKVPKTFASAASPAPAVPRVWLISKGERMSTALEQWGTAHGWTVIWKAKRLARRWHAPAFAAIPGTFLSAVGLWAHSAIANGAPIRLIEYRANNTLVVESTNGDDNGF